MRKTILNYCFHASEQRVVGTITPIVCNLSMPCVRRCLGTQLQVPKIPIASFSGVASHTIIPFVHSRKHKAPLNNPIEADVNTADKVHSAPQKNTPEDIIMLEHFNATTTSEFLANVLLYIGGNVVSKLVPESKCSSCKSCLLSSFSHQLQTITTVQ